MKVQVRFRFNKMTGEVEEFIVDDQGSQLSEAEHNRQHDRTTSSIANVIARHPQIIEQAHNSPQLNLPEAEEPDSDEEINKTEPIKR